MSTVNVKVKLEGNECRGGIELHLDGESSSEDEYYVTSQYRDARLEQLEGENDQIGALLQPGNMTPAAAHCAQTSHYWSDALK